LSAKVSDSVNFFVRAIFVLDLLVLVVVVVLSVTARHASRSLDDRLAGEWQVGSSTGRVQAVGGLGGASIVVKDTQVDGFAVVGAVRTNVEAAVVLTVVVSVVVLVSVLVVGVVVVVSTLDFCN
jgi:hypothetical protein